MSTVFNDKKLIDLNLSFVPNPNTGDIGRLNGFTAIRRSIDMILTTKKLDKPFREDIGSELSATLFEVASAADIPAFEARVRNVIERFEPRVGIRELSIEDDLENNKLEITLVYFIKDTRQEDTFQTVLNLSE